MASKVYFADLRADVHENLQQKLTRLMKTAGMGDIDFQDKFVAIKLHFGEPGNLAFLRPNWARTVADFVKETGYHVMYRVTPMFEGNNLVASGVLMEAQSVEDGGEGIRFNVYCYNVQPGVEISYADGSSRAADSLPGTGTATNAATDAVAVTYILNIATGKFHRPDCSAAQKLSDDKKETYTGTRESLLTDGYEPCGICKP